MKMHRIYTRRAPLVRAAFWLWDACDRYQWVPMALAFFCLLIVNYVELN